MAGSSHVHAQGQVSRRRQDPLGSPQTFKIVLKEMEVVPPSV